MEYELKNKLIINDDFVHELITKSWAEIDQLLLQSKNIENTVENSELIQLFKNLLTSYYVFVGGLENLSSKKMFHVAAPAATLSAENNSLLDTPKTKTDIEKELEEPAHEEDITLDVIEPFEYFVDFDEPTGEPLTDEDLYN
jgi:hypothetical protein